jgi:hypothetical protein
MSAASAIINAGSRINTTATPFAHVPHLFPTVGKSLSWCSDLMRECDFSATVRGLLVRLVFRNLPQSRGMLDRNKGIQSCTNS